MSVVSLAFLGAVFTGGAATSATGPTDEDAGCVPGCPIYPILGVDAEVDKSQLKTSTISDFPTTQTIRLSYSWDMDQEGTGVPGDAEEMTVMVSVSKKPSWIRSVEVQPSTRTFMLNPAVNEYELEPVELTVTFDPQYLPMKEEDLDFNGKRLMLFAQSRESGTFKPGFGVEDMRWKWDAAPDVSGFGADAPVDPDTKGDETKATPFPLLPAVGALVALAAWTRRDPARATRFA